MAYAYVLKLNFGIGLGCFPNTDNPNKAGYKWFSANFTWN